MCYLLRQRAWNSVGCHSHFVCAYRSKDFQSGLSYPSFLNIRALLCVPVWSARGPIHLDRLCSLALSKLKNCFWLSEWNRITNLLYIFKLCLVYDLECVHEHWREMICSLIYSYILWRRLLGCTTVNGLKMPIVGSQASLRSLRKDATWWLVIWKNWC